MSIADKLLTIASNTPAVAEAVNAARATASGTVIRVDDVLDVEHPLRVQLKSKNLLPFPYYITNGVTYDGITITYDDNGAVKLNGTCTVLSVRDFPLILNATDIPAGTYTLSGCPAGGAAYTYRLFANITRADGSPYYVNDYGEGGTIIVQEGDTVTLSVRFGKDLGTVEDLTFYPQLELGEKATAYAPYMIDFSGVNITRYGKNLFDKLSIPNLIANSHYDATNDWINSISVGGEYVYVDLTTLWPVLKAFNKKITFSFDIRTDLPGTVKLYTLGAYQISFSNRDFATTTDWQHKSFTVVNSSFYYSENNTNGEKCHLSWYGTYDTGVKPYIRNLQIEVSDYETAYVPYQEPQTATANTDGKVTGLSPISPTMTLLTDSAGASVECTYSPQSAADIYGKYKQIRQQMVNLSKSIKTA